jgi:hypothetical protein
MGRLEVDDEGVSMGLVAEPGRGGSGGVEVGFGSGEEVVRAATALDLRLDPNPRPLKREFRELIRRDGSSAGRRVDGDDDDDDNSSSAAKRGRGILLYYVRIEKGWVEGGNGGRIRGAGQHSTGLDLNEESTPWEARLASTSNGGRLGTTGAARDERRCKFRGVLLATCGHQLGAGVVSQIREDWMSRPDSRLAPSGIERGRTKERVCVRVRKREMWQMERRGGNTIVGLEGVLSPGLQ